ncbi:hypothetical protein ACFV0T_19065 [Streptomyces sp. NPDC059582]
MIASMVVVPDRGVFDRSVEESTVEETEVLPPAARVSPPSWKV